MKESPKTHAYRREYRRRPGNQAKAAANTKKWVAENREQYNASARACYARQGATWESWRRRTISKLRSRAKSMKLPFDLTVEDLVPGTVCPILGTIFELGVKSKNNHNPRSPSVDRFDNSKGYVRGNIRIISLRANFLKKDATLLEMRAVLAYMEGIL